MQFFVNILMFCAGLGVFLFGMRHISEGLERSAGGGIRKLFDKMSDNKLMGVTVGAGVTGVIQSSSATTVMVLGFVNAGIMTLFQATTVIMGANIGTTVTGILISLKSLPISPIFMGLTLVGIFLVMFAKKDAMKLTGNILCGLGLIFIGLDIMANSMSFFKDLPQFVSLFSRMTNPIILVLIGALFTALIQSSSATTGIIITLVASGGGAMTLTSALFVILGTNIGTCITAFMASIGGLTNTKRTALIHLLFNVLGVVIFFPILLILRGKFLPMIADKFPGEKSAFAISWFHVVFNVTTTLLLLPFVKTLVNLVTKIIPDKEEKTLTEFHLDYIDDRFLSTPTIAVSQIDKEVIVMANKARENLKLAMSDLLSRNTDNQEIILKRESEIDFITKEISKYLVKVSTLHLTGKDEAKVGRFYHTISDIERIGDHAKNFLDYTNQMILHNLTFTDDAISEISEMHETVELMYDITLEAFKTGLTAKIPYLSELENKVDMMKEELADKHIKRLSEGKCNVDSGAVFFGVLIDLERVADHLTNIAFSVKRQKDTKSRN